MTTRVSMPEVKASDVQLRHNRALPSTRDNTPRSRSDVTSLDGGELRGRGGRRSSRWRSTEGGRRTGATEKRKEEMRRRSVNRTTVEQRLKRKVEVERKKRREEGDSPVDCWLSSSLLKPENDATSKMQDYSSIIKITWLSCYEACWVCRGGIHAADVQRLKLILS